MVGRFLSANGDILSFTYPQKCWHSINWLGLTTSYWLINFLF